MDVQRDVGTQIGRFLQWGQAVTVDQARRMLNFLPGSTEDDVVELDAEGFPGDEELDIRLSSY